jgi:hypothetical protein
MYHDLKEIYWWYEMKRAIAEYIAMCDNCQRVKPECQRLAHFILVKTMYKGAKFAELYIARIICLHIVPKKIVSDRGT